MEYTWAKSTYLLVLHWRVSSNIVIGGEQIKVDVEEPRHLPISNRRRRCLLDERDRELLIMMWLHQYLKLHVLAHIFNISKSTVAEKIYHIVPIIFLNRLPMLYFLAQPQKVAGLCGQYPQYSNVVGMIDATVHQNRRLAGPRMVEFYRADKKFHFLSS